MMKIIFMQVELVWLEGCLSQVEELEGEMHGARVIDQGQHEEEEVVA